MESRCARARVAALAVALAVVVAVPGAAQLTNTTFDLNVNGWIPTGSAMIAWDPLDAAGSPVSGSALVVTSAASAASADGAVQCFDAVVPGDPYEMAASTFIPSGQSETGSAYLLVQWYATTCGADQVGLNGSPIVPSSSTDQWLPIDGHFTAPITAHVARIRLSIWKNEAGGSLRAHFDDVSFVSLALFKDGFEDGTPDSWSFAQP